MTDSIHADSSSVESTHAGQEMSAHPGGAISVEGVIDKIVYENVESGFLVGRLLTGDGSALTFIGNLAAVSAGETVRLRGHWVDNLKFGRQFKLSSYEIIQPTSREGIQRYLGSGLIDGIGPVYAKRIVDHFGLQSLKIIADSPERLKEVPGIGKKRAGQIKKAWAAQNAARSVMLFLQSYNIPQGLSIRIYKQYGESAAAQLRANPYKLSTELTGVGFLTADKIAHQMGIAKDSAFRIEAGFLFVLEEQSEKGHVFFPIDQLRECTGELLKLSADTLIEPFSGLIEKRKIVCDNDACYLPLLYAAEKGCAARLDKIAGAPLEAIKIETDKAFQWVENRFRISLAAEQRRAVEKAISSKVMVITGGPGTGKTTIIKSVLEILNAKGLSSLLVAPTGRAAKRMEQATGQEARTIHRLLEFSPLTGSFTRNEHNPIETDLLVVDEASMLDIHLAFALFNALPLHCRLVLVGDSDQLPSVGPGSVLRDIIDSGRVPVVRLNTIFRQKEESAIVTNAHRINHGETPLFNQHDFFMIEREKPEEAISTIVDIVTRRLPSSFHLHPLKDIQIMTPMRRGSAGVDAINAALRAALISQQNTVDLAGFSVGDKVMQMHNNYDLDVYNGDVGLVTQVDQEAKELEVCFEDERRVIYSTDQAHQLASAYCTTVHKSQGSEYPAVVLCLLPQHYMMLQRNVLYTAITRGRQKVILVGSSKAVSLAVNNNTITRRYTRLAERLQHII
jgi:exodeoxyribonuclease V alpha subunit